MKKEDSNAPHAAGGTVTTNPSGRVLSPTLGINSYLETLTQDLINGHPINKQAQQNIVNYLSGSTEEPHTQTIRTRYNQLINAYQCREGLNHGLGTEEEYHTILDSLNQSP